MKTRSWTHSLLGLAVGLAALLPAQAAVKWHFPVGLAYTSGFREVVDTVEEVNFYPYGLDDDFILPIGLTLQPYVEWDFGLGVGAMVGPASFLFVSTDYYFDGDSWSDDYFTVIVPVGAYLRYTFFPDKQVSPYLKAGVRYPLAGGDFVGDATPGFYGAVGVELWRNKMVGLGLEVGYDTSEIDIESDTGAHPPGKFVDTVKPGEWLISLFAVF